MIYQMKKSFFYERVNKTLWPIICKELESEFITKCQESCVRHHTLHNVLYLEGIIILLYF